MDAKKTMVFGGSSRLPGVGQNRMYIDLVVDPDSYKIIHVSSSLVSKEFLSDLLTGHPINDIESKVNEEIDVRYCGPLKKALKACLKDTFNNYTQYKKRSTEES